MSWSTDPVRQATLSANIQTVIDVTDCVERWRKALEFIAASAIHTSVVDNVEGYCTTLAMAALNPRDYGG